MSSSKVSDCGAARLRRTCERAYSRNVREEQGAGTLWLYTPLSGETSPSPCRICSTKARLSGVSCLEPRVEATPPIPPARQPTNAAQTKVSRLNACDDMARTTRRPVSPAIRAARASRSLARGQKASAASGAMQAAEIAKAAPTSAAALRRPVALVANPIAVTTVRAIRVMARRRLVKAVSPRSRYRASCPSAVAQA